MGNPEFAIPTLEAIQKSNHDLIAVISNPPKPMGRGRKIRSTPVGEFAKKNHIKLIEPNSLKSAGFKQKLINLNPDIFVVVAFKILPQQIIDIPSYGSINLHASLLPKYRGAAPIQWALMNGDKITGITIFQIVKNVDTGNILLQKDLKVLDSDNMLTLGTRLCSSGASLTIQALDKIEKKTIKMIEQNHDLASIAPKISKEMRLINWKWPSNKIHNWIRGLSPSPGMYTYINNKSLRIYKTSIMKSSLYKPGEIIEINKRFLVGTGEGILEILEMQLEGKKRLPAIEFIKGAKIATGFILG